MINGNPLDFINMIRNNANPQQAMLNFLQQQMGNTPMGQNLLNLARNGQTNDIENIVRNMMKQQGRDFDKEFSQFKQMLGLK